MALGPMNGYFQPQVESRPLRRRDLLLDFEAKKFRSCLEDLGKDLDEDQQGLPPSGRAKDGSGEQLAVGRRGT